MKYLYLIILILFATACKNESTSAANIRNIQSALEDFDWLLGKWQRSNEQEDRETIEIWNKKNNNEYEGLGFTFQNNDTIWKENIRLVKTDAFWNFEATGEGESDPTVFKLTTIEKEGFIAENPDNDFPKVIQYSKKGNNLNALISGGGMEVPFEFEKIPR